MIEKRGREWDRAMAAVQSSVEAHRAAADEVLAPTFRASGQRGGAEGGAMVAVRERLDEAAVALQDQVTGFADGWTAPRPRKWNERHPIAFAVTMAVIGAALALAARTIV
ncbi:MAG: hypothetical protein EON55_29010 [Alphaproteobacteria bacterium]|nr:MAG: hypothetical protein EON55_29010 [Alphaproteobacteria bacterium]